MSTIALAHWMPVACATVLVRFTNAGAPTFLRATAIAKAINSMPSACAAALVKRMQTWTACATMWTTASGNWTPVGCATVPVRSTCAVVLAFPKAIATARATSWMRWACVGEPAVPMRTWTASVTTSTCASVPWTNAASATVPERFTSADVQTSLKATATARATSLTHLVCVVVSARRMRTWTGFVTTSTTAWANWTRAASATVQARFTSADVQTFLKGPATAKETRPQSLWIATETACRTSMPMAFATTSTIAWTRKRLFGRTSHPTTRLHATR